MSLVENDPFPGHKKDDWQSPFNRFNLKTPCVLIASTIAGILERKNTTEIKETDADKSLRKSLLVLGYGWPEDAVDLFEQCLEDYDDPRMIKKLRKYHADYKDYYGGTEQLESYTQRGQKRAKKRMEG